MADTGFHPILTPGDFEVIDQAKALNNPAVEKLIDMVRRLAKVKVSEGYFPKYAAMINEAALSAFACRLAEKVPMGHGRLTWNGDHEPKEHCALMTKELECGPEEAFLLVRPCISIAESVTPETRRRLAALGTLCVNVRGLPLDGEKPLTFMSPVNPNDTGGHLWRGPVSDFLADENGYGVHRQPSVLTAPSTLVGVVFASGLLDTQLRAVRAELGVFLTNGVIVSVDLSYPILADEKLTLDVGLVMAKYGFREGTMGNIEGSDEKS